MLWMRRLLSVRLPVALLGALLAGCSFPDAALWRAAAYNEISAAQLEAGDVEGARLSAGEALLAASDVREGEFGGWAAGVAAAALARLAPNTPELDLFLTELQLGDRKDGAFPNAVMFATAVAAHGGDLAAASSYAGRVEDSEERRTLESLAVLLTGSRDEVLQLVSDELAEEHAEADATEDERAKRLSIAAVLLARHRDPELALEVFDRAYPEIAKFPNLDMPVWVPLYEGFVLRLLEGYRDVMWTGQAYDVQPIGNQTIVTVAIEIALTFTRHSGFEAATEIFERVEPGDDRIWAYALLAHRLVAVGRLSDARLAANVALDAVRFSVDVAELDEEALVTKMPTLYLLAAEAIPLVTTESDSMNDAHKPFNGATRMALVQAYLGDRVGADLTLAGVEARLMPDIEDESRSEQDSWESLAHSCWVRVLVGDVLGALDLAWQIEDPDVRAFALLPVVAALAERGDFAGARELADTMIH